MLDQYIVNQHKVQKLASKLRWRCGRGQAAGPRREGAAGRPQAPNTPQRPSAEYQTSKVFLQQKHYLTYHVIINWGRRVHPPPPPPSGKNKIPPRRQRAPPHAPSSPSDTDPYEKTAEASQNPPSPRRSKSLWKLPWPRSWPPCQAKIHMPSLLVGGRIYSRLWDACSGSSWKDARERKAMPHSWPPCHCQWSG